MSYLLSDYAYAFARGYFEQDSVFEAAHAPALLAAYNSAARRVTLLGKILAHCDPRKKKEFDWALSEFRKWTTACDVLEAVLASTPYRENIDAELNEPAEIDLTDTLA